MTSDEAAAMIYVDGDVGRLVAVERAFGARGARLVTAVSVEHVARLLHHTRGVRIVAADAASVDLVDLAALLARTDDSIGLVLLTSEASQRERLARERGIVAMFSRSGPADAIARRLASVMLLPVWEGVTLATVLRLCAAVRSTVTVRVDGAGADERGAIWIESGQIIHAERGETSGSDAVVAMLNERERHIGLDHETRATQRTVHFDMNVFLSSFDLPEDEPELELVDERTREDVAASDSWDSEGSLGVLGEAARVEGVVSATLFDAQAERLLARVGLGLPDPFPRECPEAAFWAALGAGRQDAPIEDAIASTASELLLFVPIVASDRLVLCLQLDPTATNLSLAKMEARRIAAIEPALHDLALAFRGPARDTSGSASAR